MAPFLLQLIYQVLIQSALTQNAIFHVIMIVDIEFGRLQATDMLQHLWTGPISNASLDVVQGSRSVEVRVVGVTKVLNL